MFSINENKYTQMTDEKLIENIKKDDQKALNCLINRYNDIVSMKANKFFMIGAEKEDIMQEGMIGLYKAIKSFDTQKQNSFKTFANMCIERQLITAVKNSNRQKHIPLNSSISLNAAAYEDNEDTDKIEILDINLEDSNMRLDFDTNKLYYEDVYESIVIFKKIVNHYGKGAISARTEFDDYYIVNPLVFVRKMTKFALIKQTIADGFILYFDQADELMNTWIYKYLKNKEEE